MASRTLSSEPIRFGDKYDPAKFRLLETHLNRITFEMQRIMAALSGGTAGQVLSKVSKADYAAAWAAAASGSGDVTDGQNIGAGAEVFAQKVAGILLFRTITGTGISITQSEEEINLAVEVAATNVSFDPSAPLTATNVQDAIEEILSLVPGILTPAALTKVDDTNVTLTLTGTPATALLQAVEITVNWAGALGVTRGGTSFASYTAGDTLYANSTTTLAKLAIGSANDFMTVAGGAPSWAARSTLFANPSATFGVNLVGANGTAITAIRSDAVLKLDQSIAPTWTSEHRFTGALAHSVASTFVALGLDGAGIAEVRWISSTAAANAKRWDAYADGSWTLRAVDDAPSVVHNALEFQRTGVALTLMNYGNATDLPSHVFYGSVLAVGAGFNPTTSGLTIGKYPSTAGGFIQWTNAGAASDAKVWDSFVAVSGLISFRALNDAGSLAKDWMNASRSGYAITGVSFGNTTDWPTITMLGPTLASGQITAAPSFTQSGLFSAVFSSGGDHYTQFSWYSSTAGTNNKIWDALIIPTIDTFAFRAANDAYNAATNWLEVVRSGLTISSVTFPTIHNNSGGNLRSGTYTPTLAGIANVSALVARICQWSRLGNVVTVSGYATVTPTAPGTNTEVSVTLPVASTWTSGAECMGTCCDNDETVVSGSVVTSGTTKAALRYKAATGAAAHAIVFHFTYLVQ